MSNYDKFFADLKILQNADPKQAYSDEKYRMDLIKMFNVTFGVASKILADALNNLTHGQTLDNPELFYDLCMEKGLIGDSQVWENMQNDRNISLFIYNEKTTAEILVRVISSYIPALSEFGEMLKKHAQTGRQN